MPRAHSYTTSTSPKFSSPTNSSTVWFRPQATWTSPIRFATARTRSTPCRRERRSQGLSSCSRPGEAQVKEEAICIFRGTCGHLGKPDQGLGMPQSRESGSIPYLLEGAWKLIPRVPGTLADQARKQGCNLLRPQGAQCIVKHELSEEQFMAAHGTSHPPCQLHSACLVHVTQRSEYLQERGLVMGSLPLSPTLAS